jgi:hypothetical protein
MSWAGLGQDARLKQHSNIKKAARASFFFLGPTKNQDNLTDRLSIFRVLVLMPDPTKIRVRQNKVRQMADQPATVFFLLLSLQLRGWRRMHRIFYTTSVGAIRKLTNIRTHISIALTRVS